MTTRSINNIKDIANFFPEGSPQRTDLMKKCNNLSEKLEDL